MKFSQLNLHKKILDVLADIGYSEPTEIQSKAIPQILNGLDIRASAQTGTGKTAAFLLPALHQLLTPSKENRRGPRVLILAPTRELAMQIATQADKYGKNTPRSKTVCVFGGVPYHAQMRQLARPYDILIATPGRLIDYIHQGKISLSGVELLILDEADRMLDMGFVKPIEEIVAKTPSSRQTLLFSATLKGSVLAISKKLLKNPLDITVDVKQGGHENILQTLYYVDDMSHKNRLLDHILKESDINYAVIFISTKRHADQLARELKESGYLAAALHGDMNQRHRTRTIMQLREGKLKILVATDVAARGIDVPAISHVINFDLPRDVEDYVHRIGRTGRANASGKALSFVTGKEAQLVKKIERFTGQEIDVIEIEGLKPRARRPSAPMPGKGPYQKRGGNYAGAKHRFKANAPKGRRPFKKMSTGSKF